MALGKQPPGLTLVEVLVSVAVGAIVLLAAGAAISSFSKSVLELRVRTEKSTETRNFNAQLVPIIEDASIAVQYQMLPVPVPSACPSPDPLDAPMVRQQLSSGAFQCVPFSGSGLSNRLIEFFRDDASLDNGPYSKTVVGKFAAEVVGTKPLTISSSEVSSLYATWPLKDETSLPLLLLRAADRALSLVYDYCDTVPVGSTVRYVAGCRKDGTYRFKSDTGVLTSQLLGQILVIYNAREPSQHIFQLVSSASVAGDDGVWDLGLSPLSDSSPGFASNYVPTLVSYFSQSLGGGEPTNFYSFFTKKTNVIRSDSSTRLGSVRDLANFFSDAYPEEAGCTGCPASPENRPLILGLPVIATKYFLEKGSVPPGCPSNPLSCPSVVPAGCPKTCKAYKLMMQSYRGGRDNEGKISDLSTKISVLDRVSATVLFARQLGTTTFSAVTLE